MPDGGIITIRTENLENKSDSSLPLPVGRFIKISIEDQGIGIQEKHLPYVFDPYFTTKQKASGLGLTTAYSIIKNHNGYIFADSKFGDGAIFNIYLPALKKTIVHMENKTDLKFQGCGKVLVMDDQEYILKMFARLFNRMGYETVLVKDGAQAVEEYLQAFQSEHPFNLVILDLTVPGGMGGAKTIEELLKIDSGVKAVVSSGYSNDPIMANFRDYGFCGVIPKPFVKGHLLELLKEILGERSNCNAESTV
jgi:CheY-like chemotaxis protein